MLYFQIVNSRFPINYIIKSTILNYLFVCSNIPTSPAWACLCILTLFQKVRPIYRFSRYRTKTLTKVKDTWTIICFRQKKGLYDHDHDLIDRYGVSVIKITNYKNLSQILFLFVLKAIVYMKREPLNPLDLSKVSGVCSGRFFVFSEHWYELTLILLPVRLIRRQRQTAGYETIMGHESVVQM